MGNNKVVSALMIFLSEKVVFALCAILLGIYGFPSADAWWIAPPLLPFFHRTTMIPRRNVPRITQQQGARQSLSRTNLSDQQLSERIKLALKFSQQMATNITAAHEACRLWEQVLPVLQDSNEQKRKDYSNIRVLSLSLYASCLVRVGQDKVAIHVYDDALNLMLHQNNKDTYQSCINRMELMLGRAHALQRLLRYHQATKCFEQVISFIPNDSGSFDKESEFREKHAALVEKAVLGAATCALRQARWEHAKQILNDYLAKTTMPAVNIMLFLETLTMAELLEGEGMSNRTLVSELESQEMYRRQRSPVAKGNDSTGMPVLIHRWMEYQLNCKMGRPIISNLDNRLNEKLEFMDYCAANVGAWDDPFLVYLDDKVWLHQLLTDSFAVEMTQHFWPSGFIIHNGKGNDNPLTQDPNLERNMSGKYIVKDRAGYGSHGNVIVNDIKMLLAQNQSYTAEYCTADSAKLVQRLVEPTLLLRKRKFSLRIYVVLVGSHNVYVSNEGLVKFAAAVATEGGIDNEQIDRVYMTNSGREDFMEQVSLEFLLQEVRDFELLWDSIVQAVRGLLKAYQHFVRPENLGLMPPETLLIRQRLLSAGIPKILGLDFVVDPSLRAWLIEVNRFPGLEPRDVEHDAIVKRRVVLDAWHVARSLSTNDSPSGLVDWLDEDLNSFKQVPRFVSSLVQIDLEK